MELTLEERDHIPLEVASIAVTGLLTKSSTAAPGVALDPVERVRNE